MSEHRSVLKNTMVYGVMSAVTTFALFVLYLVVARYLGAEDFGRFSFAVAFVVLFVPLLDPGLYYLTVRDVAREPDLASHYLSHVLTWKVVASPFVLLSIWIIVQFLHDSVITLQAVYLMAVSQVLHSWKDGFRPILLARELFDLDAISLAIERISLLIVISVGLVSGQGLLWVCWMFVVVRIIDLAIIALVVRYKVSPISFGGSLSVVQGLVTTAFPIGAFYMTLSVYTYIDTVMLSVLKSDLHVGWYSAAYKIYEGPVLIPAIIGTVFMPRLSRLFVDNKEAFVTLFERGIKYIVLASLAIGINGILFSEIIVGLSYGQAYENSIRVLVVLLGGLIFVFTINFLQTVMIAIDRQKVILYIALFGLVFNILLNAFLIPWYGHVGAALATVAAEAVVCLVLCGAFHRLVWKVNWWGFWVKPVVGGMCAIALVYGLLDGLQLPLQSLALNVIFVIVLYMFNIFDEEEFQALREMKIFSRLPRV